MSFLVAWLVPRVARKRRLVQAPAPGLTVVVLTFLVLAQGGGGVPDRYRGGEHFGRGDFRRQAKWQNFRGV